VSPEPVVDPVLPESLLLDPFDCEPLEPPD
jgi:hypothetical protein